MKHLLDRSSVVGNKSRSSLGGATHLCQLPLPLLQRCVYIAASGRCETSRINLFCSSHGACLTVLYLLSGYPSNPDGFLTVGSNSANGLVELVYFAVAAHVCQPGEPEDFEERCSEVTKMLQPCSRYSNEDWVLMWCGCRNLPVEDLWCGGLTGKLKTLQKEMQSTKAKQLKNMLMSDLRPMKPTQPGLTYRGNYNQIAANPDPHGFQSTPSRAALAQLSDDSIPKQKQVRSKSASSTDIIAIKHGDQQLAIMDKDEDEERGGGEVDSDEEEYRKMLEAKAMIEKYQRNQYFKRERRGQSNVQKAVTKSEPRSSKSTTNPVAHVNPVDELKKKKSSLSVKKESADRDDATESEPAPIIKKRKAVNVGKGKEKKRKTTTVPKKKAIEAEEEAAGKEDFNKEGEAGYNLAHRMGMMISVLMLGEKNFMGKGNGIKKKSSTTSRDPLRRKVTDPKGRRASVPTKHSVISEISWWMM